MESYAFIEQILYVIFGQIIFADRVLLAFLIMGTLLLVTQKYFSLGRKLIITSTLSLLIIMSPFPRWGMTYLENYYERIETIPPDITGIIVLGGSHDLKVSTVRHNTAYNFCGGRLIQALELIHQNPQLKVIFSGCGHIPESAASEVDMSRQLIENLDIKRDNICYENVSKTTIENALMTAGMAKHKAQEKWLLVTSAFHMPRSVGLFRRQGLNVTPCPVDYHTTGSYDWQINSLAISLLSWKVMTNEILGMLRNWLFNHSDTIWPHKKT